MNTKIINKLREQVKLEVSKKKSGRLEYKVFKRSKEYKIFKGAVFSEWELALTTSSASKAIHMKHNLWMLVLRDLGYRQYLADRAKKRMKSKK
jgi:hypothetical protein